MAHIEHHLTDDLLMAYASGNLPEAFSLVVATHISLCDECRAQVCAFEAIGGALVGDADEAVMKDNALDATLRLIERSPQAAIPVRQPTHGDTMFPLPLQDYVGGDLSEVHWRSVPGGVKQALLKTSGEGTVRLLSIPAGSEMPDHGHRGTELTMVLQGAFRDEDARFGRGDVEVADEDMHHTPVAEGGADCICLAATNAPLRFSGWLPRVFQPFFRI